MSAPIRDLWPADIKSEEVITPEEILRYQAQALAARTNGLLLGHVVRLAGDDRVILGFEVEAPRAEQRMRLFAVEHRLEFDYPVAIQTPQPRLPDFLKERIYEPGIGDILGGSVTAGKWIKNDWVATSPTEFVAKVEELLGRADIKGIVLSMLARAAKAQNGDRAG